MSSPRSKIGQYLISKKLGEGGMGAVYLGEHEFTGRMAAIKMISSGNFENEDSTQRLKDEARALGKISHPNIVNVIDFFPEGGAFYLVLEYVNGVSLDKLFKVSEINLFQAVDTALKAGRGIAAAHAHNILHRDIKPQNVMISESGEVKLMDFGLAKFADATSKTRTGIIMGTPRYMSPEQCRGTPLDARSDLYSYGVLVYRLACGREPFTEGDAFQVASKHVYERPPAPEVFNADIPPELSRIILKALAKNPEERYPDMGVMLLELEQVCEALKTAGTADTAPLTATLALSQLQQAAVRHPGGEIATPGPRTPSGLRYTGIDMVYSKKPATAQLPESLSAVNNRKSRNLIWIVAAMLAVILLFGVAWIKKPWAANVGKPGDPSKAAQKPGVNRWIKITQPVDAARIILGIGRLTVQPGFHARRRVTAPPDGYEVQQHEVSWGELDPWLSDHPKIKPLTPEWLPKDFVERNALPATGLYWADALAYCNSLGGSLPTEEQWEFAARGAALRPYSWGDQRPDALRLNYFAGPAGKPAPVMHSDQDRTPGSGSEAIYDLTGNVQEWTIDLWREDQPRKDEEWVQEGATSYRAIRGLPLTLPLPTTIPPIGAAWREALCATGVCLEIAKPKLMTVGFRCVRKG